MRQQIIERCLLLSVILVSVACNHGAEQFSAALSRALMDGSGTIVEFKELTDFEWDKLYVYGPYTSYADINARHGTQLRPGFIGNLAYANYVPEGECVLVFRARSQNVAVVRYPRDLGITSLETTETNEVVCIRYTPRDAIFRVELVGRERLPHLIEAVARGS